MTKEPARLTVRFANIGHEVEALEGETLLQCARRTGVRIVGACGGRGACGSCAVRIISGRVDFLSATDSARGRPEPGAQWVRACLVRPLTDCVVEVAPRALAPVVRTDVAGAGGADVPFAPLVRTRDVELVPAELAEAGGDLERLQAALGEATPCRADIDALQTLPEMLRGNGWRLRACVREGEILGFIPPGRRPLGLAVDLGTTNAAAYLMDMETGALLASLGIENPQVAYGADLVSRVNHAVRAREGRRELQAAATGAITALAAELCAAVGARPEEIVDIAVCGNTAMHHLLLGLPVAQLGWAPFVPAACAPIDVKARDIGISVLPGAWLHVLPNIGGFVGGDHVAALLATQERWSDGTTLLIDIGTNTEISLVHRDAIVTASTASGPALEGGNISCGMRAAEGAIERVRFIDGEILTEVIGAVPPVGLCGSGVIDALAALSQAGIVDRRGRIVTGHPAVHEDDGRRAFLLAPHVAFTQEDVRAVQLAKAAIRAGIDLLLREAGLAEQEVGRVVIAGAFGVYLDIVGAVAIGMFPSLPPDRFEQVGNAAGIGVRLALASGTVRELARHLAARCRHLELGTRPDFQKVFLSRIGL